MHHPRSSGKLSHDLGNTISFNNVTQIVKTGGDPLLDENAFANTSTLTARLVSRAQQSCFYLLTPDSGPRARPPRLIKLLQYVRRQVPPVSQTRLRWWRFYRPVSAFSLFWSDGVGRLGDSSRTKRMESTGSRRSSRAKKGEGSLSPRDQFIYSLVDTNFSRQIPTVTCTVRSSMLRFFS